MSERSEPTVSHPQPSVHGLVSCVRAPTATLCRPDGDVTAGGAAGFYLGDRRLLSSWELRADGRALEVIASDLPAPDTMVVRAVVRDGSEPTPDPSVVLVRTRRQHGEGFNESIEVSNFGERSRIVVLRMDAGCDGATTSAVKGGDPPGSAVPSSVTPQGVRFEADGHWVEIRPTAGPAARIGPASVEWPVMVVPRSSVRIEVEVAAGRPDDSGFRPGAPRTASPPGPRVRSGDERIDRFVRWGLADLEHLLVTDPAGPDDVFPTAGSPWYFTLFGRDSLWAARMMLPFGTGLAESTLRVLARRQGTRDDPRSLEQPGRILHELRADDAGGSLPARYFGSIDATALWMATLVEAWRWGAPEPSVRSLLPTLERCAGWLTGGGADPDGDGLVEYRADSSGLSNQGWKDSGDGITWQDGELARGPIALCEVQGYSYEAAIGAATLLDRFDRPGSARLREFAARIHRSFHSSYWLSGERGDYVAVGLDGQKRAITGVTSNPGHLLGTGLLDPEQERRVADLLVSDLATVAGLRTLGPSSRRFNPVSYHNGSVWPHDTAIAARGMVLAGLADHATVLLAGLVRATDTFGPRLPELYGVLDDEVVAYPAACRPQAWVSAAAAVMAWALAPVVPGPAPGDAPVPLTPVGLAPPVEVVGLRVGGREHTARVGADRAVTVVPIDA